ncbi:paraneoplastic antigen Ma6F-like [Felis catus]|uniref:paraneoplastic antigen Ma6F-like n=1 Tax=Felis catus TaxID=9685 RepID=UPI001D19B1CC|nr:paraneoplastic antigen Ma6F-like [Felis catus]
MAVAVLRDWCRWMGVNEQRSLLILGIPDDCEDQEFQEAVKAALQPLGRYRVLGKVFRKEFRSKVALVEMAQYLNRSVIPRQIPGMGGPWTVVFLPQAPESESEDTLNFLAQTQRQAGVALAGEAGAGDGAGAGGKAASGGQEGAGGGAAAGGEEGGQAEAGGQEGAGAEAEGQAGGEARSGGGAGAGGEEGTGGKAAAGGGAVAGGEEGSGGRAASVGQAGPEEEAGESDEEGAAGDAGIAGLLGSVSVAGAAGEAGPAGEEGAVGVAGAIGAGRSWTQPWSPVWQPVLENRASMKLRTFPGMEEPHREEESFESWLDHASDTLYLWCHITERERRRRLMESLGGPALDLVCGLLAENPDVPAQDCLAALVQVFGRKDTPTTAWLKFLTCGQRPQETLFVYVIRLEGLLQSAVEKGAIHPNRADQLRVRQVLMRARPNEMLENKLRKMRLDRRPPGFLGMLRLIQETEAWEATAARSEHLQVEEGARVGTGGLAAAWASGEVAEASPAREDASQAALANLGASEAVPGSAEADTAAPEAHDVARAALVPEEAPKIFPATQEDENAPASAGLDQARPSEAPGGPTPAQMGSASREGPGGPGCEPEGLAQAGDQEAGEPLEEGPKPIPEESGNEDGAGEVRPPKSSSGK